MTNVRVIIHYRSVTRWGSAIISSQGWWFVVVENEVGNGWWQLAEKFDWWVAKTKRLERRN